MKNRKTNIHNNFDFIKIGMASPEKILDWSYGEVTKAETMNYRTQRSEKHGLFDEKIFGPEKDFECYCGKYRGIRYKGIVCEKCGVEVTRAIVRRERMGHIELATPVAHIWFLRSMPSRIGLILGMSTADLEKVVYFAGYLVTSVDDEERKRLLKELDSEYKNKVKTAQDKKTQDALKELMTNAKKDIESIQKGQVLDEIMYHKYSIRYGTLFEAEIGAEAIYKIFQELDLPKLKEELEKLKEDSTGITKDKLTKRINLINSLIKSNQRPEWMFLSRIPVIPPGLRPMVALDGGRNATADVNDLYRRVINRNNRLKKLIDINAPDVILRNEKRILQEAVDALIDNSIRHGNQAYAGASQAQKRPLKSLSDNLKGKRGLLRGNLLGKRVDYSGRSVIVVGPELDLDQCGLPKHMALELFKPFVISKLLEREFAFNIRGAGRLIDDGVPEVWEVLEEVIQGKYVLLNRAPTLHRLGIQAFRPVLIEGNAIQVHPLVCTAFNADFDGDQMAVHVPLSNQAQCEAREIIASDKNILKPGDGDPIVSAKLDIVFGVYWMTKDVDGEPGEGNIFPGPNSAITAYDYRIISLRSKIKVRGKEGTKYADFVDKPIETTVGRILFNSILPDDYPYINKEIDKGMMSDIVNDLINRYGIYNIREILDKIKAFGFKYATRSGVTWGLDDIVVPEEKYEIIDEARKKVKEITEQYNEGFLSRDEKLRKSIEIWHGVKNDLEKIIPGKIDKTGSVNDMLKSGARGSLSQITIMSAMKGLIQNSRGETIEHPVLSSSKEGLNPIEYFITTYGSRKGLTDTALNTAKAGYLTRRLFDVAQDIIITEEDCGTKEHIILQKKNSDVGFSTPLAKKVRGRVLAGDLKDSEGKISFKKGHLITKEEAVDIENSDIEEIPVYSPMTCNTKTGVCAKCYGVDLGTDKQVDLGEAVGTVAAQAIGEPGTQLTMRTFHAGGTASRGGDITQGLPRVEEVFERRKPKSPAVIARVDGVVSEIKEEGKEGLIILAVEGKKQTKKNTEYSYSTVRTPLVKVGDNVVKGQFLTDGSADLQELFELAGKDKTQEYIIAQVNKIYELQGAPVSRKHIEVIIRQMFSRVKIVTAGDTKFADGIVAELADVLEENAKLSEGQEEAKFKPLILGITEVSLSRKSFLSSASFQHTTRMLIENAVRGSIDDLKGLKENVIIGRLIPAGSGFKGSDKWQKVAVVEEEIQRDIEEKENREA